MEHQEQLLRDHEAAAMLGCSKSTFWRHVAEGKIKRPIRIGGLSRWPVSDVQKVIENAINERDAA